MTDAIGKGRLISYKDGRKQAKVTLKKVRNSVLFVVRRICQT